MLATICRAVKLFLSKRALVAALLVYGIVDQLGLHGIDHQLSHHGVNEAVSPGDLLVSNFSSHEPLCKGERCFLLAKLCCHCKVSSLN